jgi:alpha-tubulin suppressor-like RCC1 family protein
MFVTNTVNRQLFAAGNNTHGELGVNSSTTAFSTAQACLRRVGTANANLINIKTVTGLGRNVSDNSVQIVTENGFGFAAGRNDYGQLSQGTLNTSGFTQNDPSTIEVSTTNRVFKLIRMPNSLVGQIQDCRSYGYSNGTPYHCYLWVGNDGRTYHAGYSSSFSQTGQRHGSHFSLMQPVNCD